eukprot:scaffold2950_cov67-Phaeocystis_antarctica.AAC.2
MSLARKLGEGGHFQRTTRCKGHHATRSSSAASPATPNQCDGHDETLRSEGIGDRIGGHLRLGRGSVRRPRGDGRLDGGGGLDGSGRRELAVETRRPREAERVAGGASAHGRDPEQVVEQLDGAGREGARRAVQREDGQRERAVGGRLLVRARVVGVLRHRLGEREEAGEHREEADPEAPHVGRVAVVAQLEQHLGRHVRLAPAHVVEHLALGPLAHELVRPAQHGAWAEVAIADVLVREAEVGELARAAGADQHVLELQVAVGDPLRVQELDRADDLAEAAQRLGLGQDALPAPIRVGHLVSAVQPDDALVMRDLAQQPNLGQDLGPLHSGRIDHFRGDRLTGALLVSRHVHAAERAAADDHAEVDRPPAHSYTARWRLVRGRQGREVAARREHR